MALSEIVLRTGVAVTPSQPPPHLPEYLGCSQCCVQSLYSSSHYFSKWPLYYSQFTDFKDEGQNVEIICDSFPEKEKAGFQIKAFS